MVAGVSIVPITALASFKIFFIVFWCFGITYLLFEGKGNNKFVISKRREHFFSLKV